MRRLLLALAAVAALALPAEAAGILPQILVGLGGGGAAQTISSINLSNSTFVGGSSSGTVVGALTVTMSPASPAFSGSLALGTGTGCAGTDNASFQVVSGNLETNGVVAPGSYSVGIVATQSGISNSPFCHEFSITGTGTSTSTWDPARVGGASLSGGNLTVSCTGTNVYGKTFGVPRQQPAGAATAKYYMEVSTTFSVNGDVAVGFGNDAASTTSDQTGPGSNVDSGNSIGFDQVSSSVVHMYNNSSSSTTLNFGWVSGDRLGIAAYLSPSTNTVTVWVKNVTTNSFWNGVSTDDPATLTGGITAAAGATMVSSGMSIGGFCYTSGESLTGFWSSSGWTGTAPSGYTNWP